MKFEPIISTVSPNVSAPAWCGKALADLQRTVKQREIELRAIGLIMIMERT